MYKVLTIGGKDYRLEYNVEASLYKDGVDRLINFLSGAFGASGEDELTKGLSDEDKTKVRIELMQNLRSEVINLPDTALTLFYAGLLEYHGLDGDGSILHKVDAKKLVKQLFAEQPEGGITDFASLLELCMNQMGEDGFFKRTGLERIAEQSEAAKPNRATRRAQKRVTESKS